MNLSNLEYLIRLIDRYGIEIVKKGKNRYYSPELKQGIIDKVLCEGCSQDGVSLDYALPNRVMLPSWLVRYTVVEEKEGDQLKWDVNARKLGKK